MLSKTIVLDASHSYLKRSELLKKKLNQSQRRSQVSRSLECKPDGTTTALVDIDENNHQNTSTTSQTPSVIFEEVVGDEEWNRIHGRSKHRPAKELSSMSRSFTEAVRDQRATIDNGKLSIVNAQVTNIDTVSSAYASRIQTLYMSGNLLRSLVGIEQFANVTILSLAGCNISYFDEIQSLGRLPQLEKLSLEGNRITSIAYYRIRVLSLCARVCVLDAAKVLPDERSQMIYLQRMVTSQLEQLRTGELKLTVLRHMAGLLSCHAQLVATVLGRFRCLRGMHVGMSESFDGTVRIVSHAGEGGRLGDVANTLRIGLAGGVFRHIQLCDDSGTNIFERRVDDICRRLHNAAMRRLPAATKAKANKALWDDLCGLCAQHHQKQCIVLTETCERSREALLCEYNKESVRQSRERPFDAPQTHGSVLTGALHVLDRLRFESQSYCGLGPHSHAPLARAEFNRLYRSIDHQISPPASPARRSRSVSPPPRPPPQTPRNRSPPGRHSIDAHSPHRESVQDRYMSILKSVKRGDASSKKNGVLLSAKKLSFAPKVESSPSKPVSKLKMAKQDVACSMPAEDDETLIVACDESFVSEKNYDIAPPPPPTPVEDEEPIEELDTSHEGWSYLNSAEVLNFINMECAPLPVSWSESVWQVEDILPSRWLNTETAVSDILGKQPRIWQAPALSATAATPKQLQKLVDTAGSDLHRVFAACSTSYAAHEELLQRSRLLRKRLVASAAAATRGLDEARQHVNQERRLNERAAIWISEAGTLVQELFAFKDETQRLRERISETTFAAGDLQRAREAEGVRKTKISSMMEEVMSAVEGIRCEMKSSSVLSSAAHYHSICVKAEKFALSLRSPLAIFMRLLRFRVRRQKRIKQFAQARQLTANRTLLQTCFHALVVYTSYCHHLQRASQWLRKCRSQRWWNRWQQCYQHSRVVSTHHREVMMKRMHSSLRWWHQCTLLSMLEVQAENAKNSKAMKFRTRVIFRRWKALRTCAYEATHLLSSSLEPGDHYRARLQFKRFRFHMWRQTTRVWRAALEDRQYALQNIQAQDLLKASWQQWRLTHTACHFSRLWQSKRVLRQFSQLWTRMRRRRRLHRRVQQCNAMRSHHLSHALRRWYHWTAKRARLYEAAGRVWEKQRRTILECRWLEWRSVWVDVWSLRVKMHAAAKLYLRNVARRHFRAWVSYHGSDEDQYGKRGVDSRPACLDDIEDSSSDSDDEDLDDIRHPAILRLLQQRYMLSWRKHSRRQVRLRQTERRIFNQQNLQMKRRLFGSMFVVWCRSVMRRVRGAAQIVDGEKEISEISIASSVALQTEELARNEEVLDEARVDYAEQQQLVDEADANLASLLSNIDETIAAIAMSREREEVLRREIQNVYAMCETGGHNDVAPSSDAFRHVDEIRDEKIRLMQSVEEGYRDAVRTAEKQLLARSDVLTSTDQAFGVAKEAKQLLESLQAELDVLDKQKTSAEVVLADAQKQLSCAIERAEEQRITSNRKDMEAASAHDAWTNRLRAAEDEEELLLKELKDLRVKEEKLTRNAKEIRPAQQMAQDDLMFRHFACGANTASKCVSRSLSDLRVLSADTMTQAVRHSADYTQLLAAKTGPVSSGRRQLQQLRMDELNRMHHAREPAKVASVAEAPPTPCFSDSSISDQSKQSINSVSAADNVINVSIQSLSSRIRERLSQPALMR